MEAGEREVSEAREIVNRRNVQAAVSHGNETRHMMREMEVKVTTLQNTVMSFQGQIDAMRMQLASIQTKLFSGGTESGDKH